MSIFTDKWDQPTSIVYLRFKWTQTLELKWLLLFLWNFNYFGFKMSEKKIIRFFWWPLILKKCLICIYESIWHFHKIESIKKTLKTDFLRKFFKWNIRNRFIFIIYFYLIFLKFGFSNKSPWKTMQNDF